jgi:co-chaperonin GroES (HSP10)
MSFKVNPLNGWVVVSEVKDAETQVAFVLPESVVEKSEYVVMRRKSGKRMSFPIIVPRHLIVEFSHKGEKIKMVEEKYILGEIEKTGN